MSGPITHTAHVDVVTGKITVDLPPDDDDAAWDDLTAIGGAVFNGTTIDPWGADEEGTGRADAALADFGFERVGPWVTDTLDDQFHTATIRRAQEATR